jgi:hypothetical protein
MFGNEPENNEIEKDREFEKRLDYMRFSANPLYQERLKQNLLSQLNRRQKRGIGGWWFSKSMFERFSFVASGVVVAVIGLFFATYLALSLSAKVATPANPTAVAGFAITEYFDPNSQQNLPAEKAQNILGFNPNLPAKLPQNYKVNYASLQESVGMAQRMKSRGVQINYSHVNSKSYAELMANGQRLEFYQFRWNSEEGNISVQGTKNFSQQAIGDLQGWLIEGSGWFATNSNFGGVPNGIVNLESMPPDRKPPMSKMREHMAAENPTLVFGNIAIDVPNRAIRASFVNSTPSLKSSAKTLLWQKDGLINALVNDTGLSLEEMVKIAESVK